LLKLRKVELVGFKSFFEKTHLTFSGTGLSCIIGPNGCGKSNIVDAISWVLGEQSHKSLRAERMADCIFNGTAKRPPMGLAEVTLTLVDPELAAAARKVLGEADPMAASKADSVTGADTPDEAGGEEASQQADGATSHDETNEPDELRNAGVSIETTPIDDAKPFRKKRGAQKPAAESRPGEVVIGRRLYRSGQSEYLINGRAARLRDIQELFMGIGLGPDSYAIIEQGRIGQVLSSKPSDRRAIIEEAAGITKYKTKKRLAEAKLESSKLNLSRVNDIYVEVEKQLASLKRQASKARRYAEMREQMRGLLRQLLASKARGLDTEAERLARLLGEIGAGEAQQAQSVSQFEAEHEMLDRRTYELDSELKQHQNLIGQTALELDRAENRMVFNRQRGEELTLRAQQLASQGTQAAAQLAQVEARVAAQDNDVAALRAETAEITATLAALAGRAAELASAGGFAEQRIGELGRVTEELDEMLIHFQDEQAQAAQSLAHHSGALERLEASEQQLLESSRNHTERSRLAEIRWESVNDQARTLQQSLRDAQAQLANQRMNQQQATAQCESLRDSLAAARARRETLAQILNDRSYTAEAVQKLFASHAGNATGDFRAVGVLADYAEVEPRYEGAVEQFLRDELEYVVVETFDHARAGIALLREEVGGRATFFVDSLRNLHLAPNEPPAAFTSEPAVVSRLDRLVEFRDPLGAAAKQFLPRLQSAFLVETAPAAERLARENRAYNFLTPDGTCYQGRAVTGGRPAEAGPLVMKRELRSLETLAARLEHEAAEAQAALERAEMACQDAAQAVEQITWQHVEIGKLVVAATLERDQSRSEMGRLGAELATCQDEIGRLRQQAESAGQRAAAARERAEKTVVAREAASRESAESAGRIAEIRQAVQTQQEELAVRRAAKAALDERFASAAAIAARLEEERRELSARATALDAQQRSITAEQEELVHQNEEQQRQAAALRAECERLAARKTDLENEWNQARARNTEVDDALRTSRQTLSDLREERGKHEIERARNDAEREHLRESCVNELNAQPEDLIAEQPSLLGGEDLAAADAQYQEMKSRIASMGPVNMMALEEYNECEQRFGFLGREREDLLQSIADTQQAITELDEVSRQRFEEAFAIINTHFAGAFQTLFGGGTGQMRLSEADSSGEAGIDIAAQPPGKRLQNVLLLSGGEKALTALALLIAIFRYQPSPFCILDEVDAPLDETNVGRFAQMVAEMSADAQFIVVTHNRRTMEMASVLYGVTMQEPGVSKLVSVNWDQARAAAASNAA
jgi:chromosome segregation protein